VVTPKPLVAAACLDPGCAMPAGVCTAHSARSCAWSSVQEHAALVKLDAGLEVRKPPPKTHPQQSGFAGGEHSMCDGPQLRVR
jgi:hypothetical protein